MPVRGISVEGMDQLAGQFKRITETARGQELRDALLEAAREIRDESQRRAPVAPYATRQGGREIAPGGLKSSFRASPGRQYKTFLQAFALSLGRLAPHTHLVHFGTKPHAIQPKNGKKMRIAARAFAWLSRVGDQVRTKVFHPGSRPNPFMSDAVKAKRTAIKRLLERRVKAAFDALARAS